MTSICIAQVAVPTWQTEYDLVSKTLSEIPEPPTQFELDNAETCEALLQRHTIFIELSKQVELRITTRIRRLESLMAQWKHVLMTLNDYEQENGPREILYLVAPQTYLRATLDDNVEETKFVLDVGANVSAEFTRTEVLKVLRESTDKLKPLLEQFSKLKDTSIRRKTRCEVSVGRIKQAFAAAQKEIQAQQQQMVAALSSGGGLSVPSTIKEDDAES